MAFSKYDYDSLPFVLFGSTHSYRDLGLILVDVKVNAPELKTLKYSTFYSDGDIDETEAVRSTRRYKNRKITLEFKVIETESSWNAIHNGVRALNGLKYNDIFISTECTHYSGRVSLNPFKTNKYYQTIAIDIDASPIVLAGAYWKEYTYKFPTGTKSVEIDISNLTINSGDVIYIGTWQDRYVTVEGFAEKFAYGGQGSNYKFGLNKIGTTTGSASKITVRTSSSSASYLAREFKLVLNVAREKNGW